MMWVATSVGRASKNFDTREVSGKDGSRVFFALGGERFYAFERVGQAHAFVFEGAHGMVGEDFDAFDDGVGLEIFGQGIEARVVVGDAGNNDVAQPHGFTDLLQVVEKTRIVIACDADVVFMNGVVDGFHVEENQVGSGGSASCRFGPDGAGRVERSVNAFDSTEVEEGFDKLGLQQRFAAGAGDAARFDEVLVLAHFANQFFGREFVFCLCSNLPCVGIVAEFATHGAALQEGDEADAGAVYRSHRFEGMDASDDRRIGGCHREL